MTFGYTILYVASVSDTLDFYEQAFGFKRKLLVPDETYGELSTGTTTLAFAAAAFAESLSGAPHARPSRQSPTPPMELGFVTEDVHAAFDRAVAAGALEVKPPAAKPWGQLVGYVRDSDGFLIEICSPLTEV